MSSITLWKSIKTPTPTSRVRYTMKNIPPHFSGKYLALVDEEIVAVGNSYLEVYKTAKKMHPTKLISLDYAPTKRETVTFL